MNILGSSFEDKDLVLEIIERCGSDRSISGRKKLMKLLFFTEYYDFDTDMLTTSLESPDFDFLIYKFGPFSKDVMKSFDVLKNKGLIKEKKIVGGGFRIKITDEGRERLEGVSGKIPEKIEKQMSKVSEKFGDMHGNELESESLEYLGISEEEKEDYIGTPVEVLITEGNN